MKVKVNSKYAKMKKAKKEEFRSQKLSLKAKRNGYESKNQRKRTQTASRETPRRRNIQQHQNFSQKKNWPILWISRIIATCILAQTSKSMQKAYQKSRGSADYSPPTPSPKVKISRLFTYKLPPGTSFIKILEPSVPKKASILFSDSKSFTFRITGKNSKFANKSAQGSKKGQVKRKDLPKASINGSKPSFSKKFETLPKIFSAPYFTQRYVTVASGTSFIYTAKQGDDTGMPSAPLAVQTNPTLINFSEVFLVFGNYIYGLDSAKNGLIWDLQGQKMVRNSTFKQELFMEKCGFIYFLRSFLCSMEDPEIPTQGRKYLKMPLGQDRVEIEFLEFDAKKPYPYRNRTILGCFADPNNLYCQFFDPSDNSSSTITINNIHPFMYLKGFESSFLPISELQMVSVSLNNRSINFYDLENAGQFLATFDVSNGASNPIRPVFSNVSFQMAWQVDMNSLVVFKLAPRYSVVGCLFYDYSADLCISCAKGYTLQSLSKQSPISRGYRDQKCVKNIKIPQIGNSTRLGLILPNTKWRIQKLDYLTNLQLRIKVDFGNLTAEKWFYEDFKMTENLIISSYDVESVQDYCEFRLLPSPASLLVNVTFKKDSPRMDLNIMVLDSPRNGEVNGEKSRVASNQSRLLLADRRLKKDRQVPRTKNRGYLQRGEISKMLSPQLKITDSRRDRGQYKDYSGDTNLKKRLYDQKTARRKLTRSVPRPNKSHEIFLPSVLVPSYSVTPLTFTLFYVCRGLEIALSALLLARPFIKNLRKVHRSLWLLRTIMAFQALSFIPLVSIYFYEWFDRFTEQVLKIFLSGFLGLGSPQISRTLSLTRHWFSMGKITEYRDFIDYTVLNKQFYPMGVYGALWLLSGACSWMRWTSKLSTMRVTFAFLILVPQSVFMAFNSMNYFWNDKQPTMLTKTNLGVGLASLWLLFFDFFGSFSSATYKKNSFLGEFYPKDVSSLTIFSPYVFTSKETVRYRFKVIQKSAFLRAFKWPIFSGLIAMFSRSQIALGAALVSWALFYLLNSIYLACFREFNNGLYLAIHVAWNCFMSFLCFLFLLCAIDYEYHLFNLFSVKILSFLMFLAYIFLWVIQLIQAAYILIEVIARSTFWRVEPSQSRYLVDKDSTCSKQQKIDFMKFTETDEEKLIRSKVRELAPYDFWVFLKSQTHSLINHSLKKGVAVNSSGKHGGDSRRSNQDRNGRRMVNGNMESFDNSSIYVQAATPRVEVNAFAEVCRSRSGFWEDEAWINSGRNHDIDLNILRKSGFDGERDEMRVSGNQGELVGGSEVNDAQFSAQSPHKIREGQHFRDEGDFAGSGSRGQGGVDAGSRGSRSGQKRSGYGQRVVYQPEIIPEADEEYEESRASVRWSETSRRSPFKQNPSYLNSIGNQHSGRAEKGSISKMSNSKQNRLQKDNEDFKAIQSNPGDNVEGLDTKRAHMLAQKIEVAQDYPKIDKNENLRKGVKEATRLIANIENLSLDKPIDFFDTNMQPSNFKKSQNSENSKKGHLRALAGHKDHRVDPILDIKVPEYAEENLEDEYEQELSEFHKNKIFKKLNQELSPKPRVVQEASDKKAQRSTNPIQLSVIPEQDESHYNVKSSFLQGHGDQLALSGKKRQAMPLQELDEPRNPSQIEKESPKQPQNQERQLSGFDPNLDEKIKKEANLKGEGEQSFVNYQLDIPNIINSESSGEERKMAIRNRITDIGGQEEVGDMVDFVFYRFKD